MRPRLIPVVVSLLLLSGCSSPPEAEGPQESGISDDGRPEVEIRAELPLWELGQGWRYVMDVPGHRAQTVTMTVAEERDDLWVVAAQDHEQALHHALYSLSPVLGRNWKETLSPFQDGEPVQMYQFPLTDGKRWTAGYFGESMEFHARFVGDILLQPELGLGDFAEGFRITARGESGTRVEFDYVEAAQWFTRFEVIDPEGRRQIRFDLLELLDGQKGDYWFYRGEDLLIEGFEATPEEPFVAGVEVPHPERHMDGLAIAVSYLGLPSTLPPLANVTLRGPPEEPPLHTVYFEGEFQQAGHRFRQVDLPVDTACLDAGEDSCEGSFRLDLRLVGDVEVEVRVVSYQVFAEGSL